MPQSAASSASRYQLLRHPEICKHFTHGKTSQRMTFREERFHSALLVSKPVLQKHDECTPGLTGHVLGTCRSTVRCKVDSVQTSHGRPPAHRAHHPMLCTKLLIILPAADFCRPGCSLAHAHTQHDVLICTALHLPHVPSFTGEGRLGNGPG